MTKNHFVIFNPNGKIFSPENFSHCSLLLGPQNCSIISTALATQKNLCQFSITDDPLVKWG